MASADLLKGVKQAIREVEPNAQLILFGSRARRDASPVSDWDFLVLVDGAVDDVRKDRIRHRLYEIEWDTGEVLSAIVYERREWEDTRHRDLPFRKAVEQDGRPL